MVKAKQNWKTISITFVVVGLILVFAGLGISLLAVKQYDNVKNQTKILKTNIAIGYAESLSKSISKQLQDATYMTNLGVTVMEIGAVTIIISLVSLIVQRLSEITSIKPLKLYSVRFTYRLSLSFFLLSILKNLLC